MESLQPTLIQRFIEGQLDENFKKWLQIQIEDKLIDVSIDTTNKVIKITAVADAHQEMAQQFSEHHCKPESMADYELVIGGNVTVG